MSTIKISQFQGMVPALNDTVLPDNNAAFARNAFLYSGAIQGFQEFKTLTSVSTGQRMVFRFPNLYLDADHLSDADWLPFTSEYTNVLRTSVAGDTYERYYWASPDLSPKYNTKARILARFYNAGAAGTASSSAIVIGLGATSASPTNNNRYAVGLSKGLSNAGGVSGAADPWTLGVPAPSYTPTLTVTTQVSSTYISQTAGVASGVGIVLGLGATSAAPTNNNRFGVGGSSGQSIVSGASYSPDGTVKSRSYVVTWLTEYGEEGPPCTPAVASGRADAYWTLTGLTPPSYTDRNISKLRIYRTITSTQGVATYFQIAELPASTTSYIDTAYSDVTVSANQQIQSTSWYPPPSDLKGWVAMPNGIIAGWRGKEVWFCEPYRPHAWPPQYALTTEYDIVGLGIYGQTLIVCTQGFPTAITGINPLSMTMAKVSTFEPCMSRGSIVSAPEGVYYASPNGLILAAQGQFTNVTKQFMTKDKWQNLLSVSTARAVHNGSGYLAFGGVRPGCFEPTAFDNARFEMDDYTGSYAGLFFDPTNPGATTTMYSSYPVTSLFTDPWSGETLFIRNNLVQWFDLQTTTRNAEPFIWRSKKFQANKVQNFEAVKVYFTIPAGVTATPSGSVNNTLNQTLDVNQYGLMRVYADDRLVATRELFKSGQMFRLPSGFKNEFWQIEFEARVNITSVQMATSARELAGV